MLIMSMNTNRIGGRQVLLPIKPSYDKFEKETSNQLYVFINKKTVNLAKCKITV